MYTSQSYGVSIAIMGSHSVTCHPTPHLNHSQTGWHSIYLPPGG